VVCTANLVRSPVAAAALQTWARNESRADLEIRSAGVAAVEGLPVPAPLVQAVRPFFLDLHSHRSQRVTRADVRDATLVLAMTEVQREALQALLPSGTPRIFTLREFARLTKGMPAIDRSDDDLAGLVQAAHRERPRQPLAAEAEDVAALAERFAEVAAGEFGVEAFPRG